MLTSRVLLSILLVVANASVVTKADEVPEYRLKAEFLERFTRFVEWPSLPAEGRPFTIGIVGRNPFGRHLDQVTASRQIKGRPVRVYYIDDVARAGDCHVLFIASSEKDRLRSILQQTESKPVLTVGDTSGFAHAGVLINFYQAGDTVRFEINEAAVEKSGLKISSKLFKLARLVAPEVR